MRTLLLEPFSGISGDMLLGALVDLGVPVACLREQVRALGLESRVELRVGRTRRAGIAATRVEVLVDGVIETPAPNATSPVDRHTPAIGPDRIRAMLDSSALDPAVRAAAADIFDRLAAAEARVHGAAEGHVHLHEVGAIDAVVDVVCSVAAVRELSPERIIATPPRDGHGEIRAAHGTLPVPAPATLVLLEGIELERVDVAAELVTPTGAALLVALADEITRTFSLRPDRIGYGAGTRDLPGRPNVLRATLGESAEVAAAGRDEVTVLETAVDDAVPEMWPWLIERLLQAGARDAFLTPVIMKKGRPGIHLTVLVDPERFEEIARLVFAETGTLGVRMARTGRMILLRGSGILNTKFGPLRVKLSRVSAQDEWQVHPEFEACRAAAVEHGVPLRTVYAEVARAGVAEGALEVEGEAG